MAGSPASPANLLCIVWVGFDDNRELDLEGAHSALPIWTEFMKRALTLRKYADAKPFEAPSGVVTVTIDPESGMPAGAQCPMQAPRSSSPVPNPSALAPCMAPKAIAPPFRAGTQGLPLSRRIRRRPPLFGASSAPAR